MVNTANLVKIRIALEKGPFAGETLWAESIGNNLYRLDNIPVYANGYAYGDIVHCEEKDGLLDVSALVIDSGNGTIRVAFTNSDSSEALHILNEFLSLNCSYEKANAKLVTISLPHDLEIPFSQVSNYLNSRSDDIVTGWEIGKRINRNPSTMLS